MDRRVPGRLLHLMKRAGSSPGKVSAAQLFSDHRGWGRMGRRSRELGPFGGMWAMGETWGEGSPTACEHPLPPNGDNIFFIL